MLQNEKMIAVIVLTTAIVAIIGYNVYNKDSQEEEEKKNE